MLNSLLNNVEQRKLIRGLNNQTVSWTGVLMAEWI